MWIMMRFVCWGTAIVVFAQTPCGAPQPHAAPERAGRAQPGVPRKVLAFYYPWYGNPEAPGGSGKWSHWKDVDQAARQIASSTHYPLLGAYDSHDPELIARHCAWARQAGVDGLIASWWGKGSFTDQAIERILAGCDKAAIKTTIYYETVPRPGTPQAAAADLLYVLDRYAWHPAWLRVEGRPVVFIYGRAIGQIGLDGWDEAIQQVRRQAADGVVFIGDRITPEAAKIFDGLHTYNTAGALRSKNLAEVRRWARSTYPAWVQTAQQFGRISTITVIPGYDDTKIRTPGLKVERSDGALYRLQWEEAIAADPHWVLITSWNEWHEGSQIEPSLELGNRYLELTARLTARFKAQRPRAARRSATGPAP